MRVLLMFAIGLFFGTGLGFLLAGGAPDVPHDHAGHAGDGADHMQHDMLTEWTGPPPRIGLTLRPDSGADHNLQIDVAGFAFTPQDMNTAAAQGTGHAHVYVNGIKVLRAYGPWALLPDLAKGDTLRVTLNANDHTSWAIAGEPLAAEVIVP